MAKKKKSGKTTRILLVGDWVVDEYHVAADQHSLTASRPGNLPLRALHGPDSKVQVLVGAGRIASLLHQASDAIELTGIGVWAPGDDRHLLAMLRRDQLPRCTPYTLARPVPADSTKGRVTLINLATILDKNRQTAIGTTRVQRIFRRTGSTFELLGRLDWQVPPDGWDRNRPREWVTQNHEAIFSRRLAQKVQGREFDAVFVKDLCKGVLSDALVHTLATLRETKNARWFISSKAWNPSWLQVLKIEQSKVDLLLIPEVAARQATLEVSPSRKVHSWFCAGERPLPTQEGMKAIETFIHGEDAPFNTDSTTLVALPSGFSAIARSPLGKEAAYQPFATIPGMRLATYSPLASPFFSCLAHDMLTKPKTQLGESLTHALAYAGRYADYDIQTIDRSYESEIDPEPTIAAAPPQSLDSYREAVRGRTRLFSWAAEKRCWDEALKGAGTIPIKSKLSTAQFRIEHWRGTSVVPGFVACVPEKRHLLGEWASRLCDFQSHRPSRHLAGLLQAPPASGKTSLVRAMAAQSGLVSREFNVTQATTREVIIRWFQEITSFQTEDFRRRLLVFVDELNAPVDGTFIYDVFLTILEDGKYVNDGCVFKVLPCAWVFASTATRAEIEKEAKGSDFVSRLRLPDLDLGITDETENVYLAVSMIRAKYPAIRYLTLSIVEAFNQFKATKREMRDIVENLHEVDDRWLSRRNFPDEIAQKFGFPAPSATDKDWVDIECPDEFKSQAT